jgi:hypothetical protein
VFELAAADKVEGQFGVVVGFLHLLEVVAQFAHLGVFYEETDVLLLALL